MANTSNPAGGAASQTAGPATYGPGRLNTPMGASGQVQGGTNSNAPRAAESPGLSGADIGKLSGDMATGALNGLRTALVNGGGSGGGDTGGGGSGGGRGGGGGGGGSTSAPSLGQSYDASTKLNVKATDPAELQRLREAISAEINPEMDPAEIDRVEKFDKQPLIDNLNQQIDAARQQYNTQIDRNVDTQALALQRALTDAQKQFQTQQGQITANEMNALDNAALYAEARGDKGGIGQAQYNSIQNTAAQNRMQVSSAQTKLATDTARQISDLRAQGEFERADKMLALTQQYLSELRQIEEYAANFNLSVDQVNTAIAEWEYNYAMEAQQFATSTELSLAQLTGMFSNGMSTYEAQQRTKESTAELALSLLQAGVKPTQLSPAQLTALADTYGMNQSSINNFFKRANW